MNTLSSLSLDELNALRAELIAEIDYCHAVDSPADAEAPQDDVRRIDNELLARRLAIVPPSQPSQSEYAA